MHNGLPPLDLLVGFEAAARHRSFTRAGAELHRTQSALSRQVQALEASLGVALFERRPRTLVLTDAGEHLHQVVARQLRELRETVSRIGGAGERLLTVTTMVTFAALWLVPRLPEFRRAHPGVDVRISARNEIADLERDRIDVAIRYMPPERAPASALRLFGEDVMPVCAPALLRDRQRRLRRPADLAGQVLLHMDDAPIFNPYLDWTVWLQSMGLADLKPAGGLYFSHYDQMMQAAVEGQGIALGRMPLISRLLRDGRLVAPFAAGGGPTTTRGYYVLTAAGADRPEVRRFVDWLRQEAVQEPPAPTPRRARRRRTRPGGAAG